MTRPVTIPVTKRASAGASTTASASTSVRRWKLLCVALAGVATYTALAPRGGADTPAVTAQSRTASIPRQLRRPLRVAAEAAEANGISRSELVERVLRAGSLRDVQVLTSKLGAVGDDQTVDQLVPLLADHRRGVPEAVLACYGAIATEHAVQMLIERAGDDRPAVRAAAIAALGDTQSERAEQLLVELAHRPGDPAQPRAIAALGTLGSDAAVAALISLGEAPDATTASLAVSALGSINNEGATAALRKLIDAPDPRVAAAALGAIQVVDDALLAKLTAIVQTQDATLASAALGALAKVGERALPALRTAARSGYPSARASAIEAIAEIGGPAATQALGELLNTGDRGTATSAAMALAGLGGKEARELLINAALSDRAQLSGALEQLGNLDGEDVDQALLTVLKSGSRVDRRTALPRLLKAGNPEALQLATSLARTGNREERHEAMRQLAGAGTPKAYDALLDIAGTTRGQTRNSALELLVQSRPSDPAVHQMLRDELASGRRDEVQYAVSLLGRLGTETSRQTLMTALTSQDPGTAAAAASALAETAMSEPVKAALTSAAASNPQIKRELMTQLLTAGDPAGMRLAEDLIDHNDQQGGANQAIAALSRMGTPQAQQLIDRALGSADPSVRVAAISSLGHNPDERSTDELLRLARDTSPEVRAAALSSLGQLGSERAQQVLFEASRSARPEDRIASIAGLAALDDPAAGTQLARLIRDPDVSVAGTAIGSAYNGGAEVDQVLASLVNDSGGEGGLRMAAAYQLRNRGARLDATTAQAIEALVGPQFGGAGYGGAIMPIQSDIEDRD